MNTRFKAMPILFKEGTQRESGIETIKSNILAVRTLAERYGQDGDKWDFIAAAL